MDVSGFFSFIIYAMEELVGLLLSLPFVDGVSYGHVLLAIVIISFIITALIGSVKVVGSIPDSLPERQTRFPDSASLGSRDERRLY